MSVDFLKADARRLSDHLRTKYGWSLKTTSALEAVAISRGYKDWNTLAALDLAPSSEQLALPSSQTASATLRPFLAGVETGRAPTLSQLTEAAVKCRASDIILCLQGDEMTIHFRVDGVTAFVSRVKLPTSPSLLNELGFIRAASEEGTPPVIAYGPVTVEQNVEGRRVALIWRMVDVMGQETLVIRVQQDLEQPLPKLDAWGERLLAAKDGLFVIGGVTGSGKTTSANLVMEHALQRDMKVAFVFDKNFIAWPRAGVEHYPFDFDDITSLRNALSHARKNNPDLILVSEIRPIRGMAAAIIEAEKDGAKILATIHAGGVRHGVEQLARELFPVEDWLYRSLRSVRVQRLLNKTCQHCRGAGCARCHQRGKKGMVVVSEEAVFDSDTQSVESALRGAIWWTPLRTKALEMLGTGVVSKAAFEQAFGRIHLDD